MIQEKLIEGAVNSYNMSVVKLLKAIRENNQEEFERQYESLELHRNTIKQLFKNNPSLEIEKTETRKVLMEIRDDKDVFAKLLNLDEYEIDDYYSNTDYLVELNTEYDLMNFLPRRIEAGAIIASRKLPRSIFKLFEKIRECYMFGLYEATIIFCRAIMEEAIEYYYISKNPKMTRKDVANKRLGELLTLVEFPEKLRDLKQELIKINHTANSILHSPFFKDVPVRTVDVNYGINSFSVKYKDDSSMQKSALAAIRAITLLIEGVQN